MSSERKNVGADFIKLKATSLRNLENKPSQSGSVPTSKWLLVLAQTKAINDHKKSKSKCFSEMPRFLEKALKEDHSEIYRSFVRTKLRADYHWNVVAINRIAWPKGPPLTQK